MSEAQRQSTGQQHASLGLQNLQYVSGPTVEKHPMLVIEAQPHGGYTVWNKSRCDNYENWALASFSDIRDALEFVRKAMVDGIEKPRA